MKSFAAVRTPILVAALLASFASPSWAATTIDFDGTGAPGLFLETSPLTNLYSGLGVTFSGGGSGSAGSILNQSGNFGFNAHSGTDFLAFNTACCSGNVEKLTFSSAVSSVSIWAAGSGTTTMTAYNADGASLFSSTINAGEIWQQLSVSGSGISTVLLTGSTTAYAYDDLVFNSTTAPIPEPETYAMMLAGLGLLGFVGRRRKQQQAIA